jgi:NSS family neurotransmitter:Na+ symporter
MAVYVAGGGFLLALFFATGGGYHWLWIVDHFINEIGLVTVGILECYILGYLYSTEEFMDRVNATSEVKIGRWWIYSVKYITPVILLVILVGKLISTVSHGFPDDDSYPGWALFIGGIFPVILAVYLSFDFIRRWPPRR